MDISNYTYDYCKQAYESWKESGLSKSTFCTKNNINEYAIRKWRKTYNKDINQANTVNNQQIKFMPIKNTVKNRPGLAVIANEAKQSSDAMKKIEIISPNGIVIKLDAKINDVHELLRRLCYGHIN